MKKYTVAYHQTNCDKLAVIYPYSSDSDGSSWAFVKDIQRSQKWYGKGAMKCVQTRIIKDTRKHFCPFRDVKPEVIELDEEPCGYFETLYAVKEIRKDDFILRRFQEIIPKEIVMEILKDQREMVDKWPEDHQSTKLATRTKNCVKINTLYDYLDEDGNTDLLSMYYRWLKENYKSHKVL